MASVKVNINDFLFGRTKAEKKLQVIDSLSDKEIRDTTSATIKRIINECKNENGGFWINSDRRVGNDWNSTILSLYIYQDKPILTLYVQDDSTDTSMNVGYGDFNYAANYHSYCTRLGVAVNYSGEKIAKVIRCILKEYIYYKYIEKDEREKKGRIDKVLHYSIVNPVVNHFYAMLGPRHVSLSWNEDNRRKYMAGQEAIKTYAAEHYMELEKKSKEEIQSIYKEVFKKAW